MDVATVQAQLDEVNAAITALLKGQSGDTAVPTQEYWEGGDRWRGVEIKNLFAERQRLTQLLDDLQSGGGRFNLVKVVDL